MQKDLFTPLDPSDLVETPPAQKEIEELEELIITPEDKAYVEELQVELDKERENSTPKGVPYGLDANGNLLTEDDIERNRDEDDGDEYGQGGRRA